MATTDTRKNIWLFTGLLGPPAVVLIIMAAFLTFIFRLPTPVADAEDRACDNAVATLFSTRDLVDMQRAQFVIKQLDCSISKRLPGVRN